MLGFLVLALMTLMVTYVIGGWFERRRAARCPKYKYVYRPYVRTFTEEQQQPSSVFKMYQDMFWKQSPWVSTTAHPSEFSRGYINPFVWGNLPKTDLGTVRESDDFVNDEFS
jgi:hypothetical protein